MLENIKIYKEKLRQKKLLDRKFLKTDIKQCIDKKIFDNVINCKEYINSDIILCYASKGIEVNTWNIIENALKNGKTVLLPRCNTGTLELVFCKIDSLSCLKKSSYGILEPDNTCEIFYEYKNSVCIVPGLSFDRLGARLGFGKGYYDRFLKNYHGYTIGLCYLADIECSLPREEFDMCVDIVITEGVNIINNTKSR